MKYFFWLNLTFRNDKFFKITDRDSDHKKNHYSEVLLVIYRICFDISEKQSEIQILIKIN